jgi:RNA polymerase sigma factor (sigma-70 family)
MEDQPPAPPSSPKDIFLANLDLIRKLAAHVARRHHASAEEAEEFASELQLKFMADDYAVFRKFKGTSSLKTYLTVVAVNFFKDFRNHHWGKWRPSAAAKALGPVAILLEKLVYREGWSFKEACEILQTNHKVSESLQELEEIWKQLPTRTVWQGGKKKPDDAPDPGPGPAPVLGEDQEIRERIALALKKALDSLSADDRLLVKMLIMDRLKIVDIAKILCMKPGHLYRQWEKILLQLKSDLEREGLRKDQVLDLLDRADSSWSFFRRTTRKPEEN